MLKAPLLKSFLRIASVDLRVVREIVGHFFGMKPSFTEHPDDFLVNHCVAFWRQVQTVTVKEL